MDESLQLSHKLEYLQGESFALSVKAQFGDSTAIELSKQSIKLAEKSGDKTSLFWAYHSLGQSMLNISQNTKAIDPFKQSLVIAQETRNSE